MKPCVKITIVTPSYNQGQFIGETIESIVTQDYAEFEYFIVDGKSTDNSLDVISRYKDHIDCLICEPDKGQTDAINKGLLKASGELFSWVNSDDILLPNCLKMVGSYYAEMDQPDIITANVLYIDELGIIKRCLNMKNQSRFFFSKGVWYAAAPVVFFNRRKVIEYGCLNDNLQLCMDLDLWMKFFRYNAKVVHIPYYLGCFRVHSKSKGEMAKQALGEMPSEREILYRNEFPHLTRSQMILWRDIYRARQILNLCYMKEVFAQAIIGNSHWKNSLNNKWIFNAGNRV
jgi:glycosyltransferase involved in cell wall biosynthesis